MALCTNHVQGRRFDGIEELAQVLSNLSLVYKRFSGFLHVPTHAARRQNRTRQDGTRIQALHDRAEGSSHRRAGRCNLDISHHRWRNLQDRYLKASRFLERCSYRCLSKNRGPNGMSRRHALRLILVIDAGFLVGITARSRSPCRGRVRPCASTGLPRARFR